MEIRRISPEEAKTLLDSSDGYIYIDVRTTQEFDAGHVPGAKNIPLLEPGPAGMQVNPDFVALCEANFPKDARLIIGCQKGGRSLRATQVLMDTGFTQVADMRGGYGGESDPLGRLTYPGWQPRGYPTTTESAREDRYEHLARK
jgi:rhodanese-related sulfurtransferase